MIVTTHMARLIRSSLAACAVVALLAAGCGGSGGTDRAKESSSTSSAPPSGDDGAGRGNDDAAPTPAPTGPAATTPGNNDGDDGADEDASASGNSGDPAAPGTYGEYAEVAISAELAEECVRPGQSQTITIRTEPDTKVAYHTAYADGKNDFADDYPGGANRGETDGRGLWTDTWVVKPTAAPGQARVDVIAVQPEGASSGSTQTTFVVATLSGSCA